MGDSLITVIAIFLAAILMFIFPLMSVSERNDDIAQLSVQTATAEFVDGVSTTGKMTYENYNRFTQTLAATGNYYDVELEIKRLDENPSKKTAWGNHDKIGENLYYSEYTTQVIEQLDKDGSINLKQGDMVSVQVKNKNRTIAQMLRSFFYSISGSDAYQIAASHSRVVTANAH